jgi:mono/diheme cytochrome c family protein
VRVVGVILAAFALASVGACDDMEVQPKQQRYTPLVGPAEVPKDAVEFQAIPARVPPVTLELIERGRDRYHVYCAPCHAELGDGRGMVVQRGFPAPPSFHDKALRTARPQQLYDAITDGYGVMYSFADRVDAHDRWAIVAYVRALERSQNAVAGDLASADGTP